MRHRREWAGRIQPALDGGATIFCYFKHEDEGASPKMAKRLEQMLALGEADQPADEASPPIDEAKPSVEEPSPLVDEPSPPVDDPSRAV